MAAPKNNGNPKGNKRDAIIGAKIKLGNLETGWKRMIARHKEEMLEQQAKIKAAKEALADLEQKEQN